jgi:polyhydroxyalkanoate synthesis repressor PhaR
MERQPVIIKKYENRRLYDTASSRYVNLDEVAQMVQEGREVQVFDAASGEDLTRLVLTQIIMEQAKAPGSAFPLDILRQMVAATNRAGQETALSYMKAIFDLYQNA